MYSMQPAWRPTRFNSDWNNKGTTKPGNNYTNFWEPYFKHKTRYSMVSKKSNPLIMWGCDRKIRPSGSLFVITQQDSWCKTVIVRTDFFYPTLTLMMDSYSRTHVLLPRLPCEGCTLVVLELTHMVVKWRQCSVNMRSSCDIASRRIQRLLEAYFIIKSQRWAKKVKESITRVRIW